MLVTHPGRDGGPAQIRRRRLLYWLTTTVLCLVVASAVADVFGPVLGVDAASVSSRAADGTTLTVEHPAVTRPALASPFSIEVTRRGGFDAPLELAVSRPWIEVWDENGMYPAPSSEVGDDQWVVWVFEPPDGDTFRFFYDARLEPAQQQGVRGAVELRDGREVLASVRFETQVRP